MEKHKLILYLLIGISVVRWLLSLFFSDCFLFHHIWLMYLSYFIIIAITLLANIQIVPLCHTVRTVECIMLGNGTMTQEKFDKRRYGNYRLLYESAQGRAYSSNNGEMIYTKPVVIEDQDGESFLALMIFSLLYTFIGIYTYEVVVGLVSGALDMNIPIGSLKRNIATLNIMTDEYSVQENLKYVADCSVQVGKNAIELLNNAYKSIVG